MSFENVSFLDEIHLKVCHFDGVFTQYVIQHILSRGQLGHVKERLTLTIMIHSLILDLYSFFGFVSVYA